MAVVIIVVKAVFNGFLRKVREGSGKRRNQRCLRSVVLLSVFGFTKGEGGAVIYSRHP